MVIKIISKGNKIETKPITPHVGKIKIVRKSELTPRDKRAVTEFAKLGKKGEALRRAGFPESIARNPQQVFNKPEIQDELLDVISKLETEREKVLERMGITRDKANYGTLSMTLAILNKDIELLRGRPTSREEYELPPEEKARLDRLLKLNS